jgi:predicted nuclease of predicted toxin-antitoxin system
VIRFLLDQNLSPKTTQFLRDLGLEVTDLRQLGKAGASDDEVYELAASGSYALVTYDVDFARRFAADKRLAGLVLLRVHPQTLENLHPVLRDLLARVIPEDVLGKIVTVESHRYRLRKVR